MNEQQIPKIIHYCWFGYGPKPPIVEKCIQSWREKLPLYEIKEWNESNFDVEMLDFTSQAYKAKKYAFVADYVRLAVLKQHGGIYLDTDVEVLKPLDGFLDDKMFCGFESDSGVAPGLILGSVKNHPLLDELMSYYQKNNFIDKNGVINSYTTVQNITDILLRHGLILNSSMLQKMDGVTVYPKITFCPDKETREAENYSKDTYTVHHYMASWVRDGRADKLEHPFWRCVFKLMAFMGKAAQKIFGKKWTYIRNKYLIRLYNFARGI